MLKNLVFVVVLMVYLCPCSTFGEDVAKEKVTAEMYRKAAVNGDAKAQYNLGLCYYNGNGVNKDMEKAVEWYLKAAEQGHAEAQYALGQCYYYSSGVNKDISKAVGWYRKAAEQGHAEAQMKLKSLGK